MNDDAAQAQPGNQPARELSEERPPTVLIVEDDDTTRFAMTEILVQEGYLVLTAATGHDALGMLHQPLAPIDVVLLDVHLPDVNGIELCTRLRELYPHLPVIVCTGEAEPADWMIEKIDPIGNTHGAPGLFVDAEFGAYIDNLKLVANQ